MGPLQNLSYEKDISAEQLITNIQYQDRLIGLYEDAGVSIMKEMTATLTGTLVPPCIALVTSILDGLLAVEQGVRNICMSYGQYGNLEQDVAAIRLLDELTREYLARMGYRGVEVYTVASQWMGDFPHDESHAMGLICWGTATAALAGVSQIMVKSRDEAFGVPSKEANADALKASRHVLHLIGRQRLEEGPSLAREIDVLRREVHAIIGRTLELGDGDVALGIVRALAAGVIDVPFSPTKLNAGRALPVRDGKGAIRFLDAGNIPLPADVLEFHREKVAERQRGQQVSSPYEMVIADIYSVR
jgi:methylaspartate mutase epsilon subunit